MEGEEKIKKGVIGGRNDKKRSEGRERKKKRMYWYLSE